MTSLGVSGLVFSAPLGVIGRQPGAQIVLLAIMIMFMVCLMKSVMSLASPIIVMARSATTTKVVV